MLWTLARKDLLSKLHCSATHGVSQNGGLFREKAHASIERSTSLPSFLRKIYQGFDDANVPGVASRVAELLALHLPA